MRRKRGHVTYREHAHNGPRVLRPGVRAQLGAVQPSQLVVVDTGKCEVEAASTCLIGL